MLCRFFWSALLIVPLAFAGCRKLEDSVNKGLEEEKSYTRHAMEYHRQHLDKRRGDSVLDTWSTADYIALDVAQQKMKGDWSKPSDQLAFLRADLRLDVGGQPFCVIQRGEEIIVLRFLSNVGRDCTLDIGKQIDTSHIQSGDMEFSGRTDYWVYVLKR